MINGVLVERTVKDVVPSLKTNADGLKQVLDELLKQYKSKQDEMESWKVRETTFLVAASAAFIFCPESGILLTAVNEQKKNNIQVVQQ